MRRFLQGRTWGIRGTGAVEATMVVAVAALLVPAILFIGASWIAYDDTRDQIVERAERTLDLLYVNVRTAFETEYLVAANVSALLDDYKDDAEIHDNEQKLHEQLKHLIQALPQVTDVWVLDAQGKPLVAAGIYP